jgi:DNA-binding MarR family transcriptional regulator
MNALELLSRVDAADVSPKRILTLARFAGNVLTVPDLASRMGLDVGHANALIKPLLKKQLIERCTATTNRAKYRMTAAGESLLNKILKP